ncbi:hypothetical protein H839_08579 [Parageobacillus genomosp. 1]|uniref:Uncharacterized protein n=1 Tax=Parageobacillus genomosp. 1 TaxID=1295642 RepID=A0ABC9VGQ1_9BACL|nr:hypothetical protein H839_08579 [Parageobacillus genomosp. 1]
MSSVNAEQDPRTVLSKQKGLLSLPKIYMEDGKCYQQLKYLIQTFSNRGRSTGNSQANFDKKLKL